MTVIGGYTVPGISEARNLALVKGAPEVLRDMVITILNMSPG